MAITIPILKRISNTICKTDEFRKKVSIGSLKSYKNGRKISGGNTKWIELDTTNGKIKVQGSYEVRVVKILENWKLNINILNWQYAKDRFAYISKDGMVHTYIVDFKIINNDNTFYYIEAKGRICDNDAYKWASIREFGYTLNVLFNKDIEKFERELQSQR
ncbi:MAG: hypothetical protein Q7R95_06945 [bacterium]|nr:hypothetical protein [bacterium]